MATDETNGRDQRQKHQASIAAAVKLLLIEQGVSQGDLANHLGVNRVSLNRSLNPNGHQPRRWQPGEVREMALFFQVPMEFFFADDIAVQYAATKARVDKEWEATVARVLDSLQRERSDAPHA